MARRSDRRAGAKLSDERLPGYGPAETFLRKKPVQAVESIMDERHDPLMEHIDRIVEEATGRPPVPSLDHLPDRPAWARDRITSRARFTISGLDYLRFILTRKTVVEFEIWTANPPGRTEATASGETYWPVWVELLIRLFRWPFRSGVVAEPCSEDTRNGSECPPVPMCAYCGRWESPAGRPVLVGAIWHNEHCPRAYGAAGDPNRERSDV